ncbi:MAG: hypothetical protein EPN34_03190 [Burkholderiaceae bacterium]|nr:MAG: hypothetical protein EPN34_03190 [Burkholderiaceae bacterium]
MTRPITINLFDVSRGANTLPLEQVLDEFAALAVADRWRENIRLDRVARVPADAAQVPATRRALCRDRQVLTAACA